MNNLKETLNYHKLNNPKSPVMHIFYLFLASLLAFSAYAQKVEVFEKAGKPEFKPKGKNGMIAQGYGYVILHNGDSVKGPLKVEMEGNTITEYVIRSGKDKHTYSDKDVQSHGFYSYNIFIYDTKLPGNPKFYPGYIVTSQGVKLQGRVAIMTVMGSEWKFFPKKIYFIPANGKMATSMTHGDLLEVGQTNKDGTFIFDAFGNGYLKRIVDGKFRLYYNPDPNLIKQPLFYNKLNSFDSAQVNALQKQIVQSIREERSLNEGIRSGKDVSTDIAQVQTEITEQEYFLIDTRTGKIHQLKETSFKPILETYYAACPAFTALSAEAKEELMNYRKMELNIAWYNDHCK